MAVGITTMNATDTPVAAAAPTPRPHCSLLTHLLAGDSVIVSVQWRAGEIRGVTIYATHCDDEVCDGLYGHQIMTPDPVMLMCLIRRRMTVYRRYIGEWESEHYPTWMLTDEQIERLLGEFAGPDRPTLSARQCIAGEVDHHHGNTASTTRHADPCAQALVEAAVARARTWIQQHVKRPDLQLVMKHYDAYTAATSGRGLIWPRFYAVCVDMGHTGVQPPWGPPDGKARAGS